MDERHAHCSLYSFCRLIESHGVLRVEPVSNAELLLFEESSKDSHDESETWLTIEVRNWPDPEIDEISVSTDNGFWDFEDVELYATDLEKALGHNVDDAFEFLSTVIQQESLTMKSNENYSNIQINDLTQSELKKLSGLGLLNKSFIVEKYVPKGHVIEWNDFNIDLVDFYKIEIEKIQHRYMIHYAN